MGHRHVTNPYMTSGLHQHDNNRSPVEQHIPMVVGMGNGPIVAPMDNPRGGVHSNSRWDSQGISNEYISSNVNMEAHRLPPPFSRPPIDPHPHSSITGNTYSHYNVPSIHNVDGGVLNPTSGNGGGGPFKRKSPPMSESGNFYSAAGSSSSSQMLMEKPDVDRHRLPPYRVGTSLSIVDEGSMRNVRSRTDVPNYPSNYYQPTPHSANYSAPVHPGNLNANVTSQGWNPVPRYAVSSRGRTLPPDFNGSRGETSQLYGGGSSVDDDGCHRDPFYSRNHVPPSQHPHVSHAQSTGDIHSYHSRRVTPLYRNDAGYTYYAHGGSSSTNELHFPTENFASRYSRHSSDGVWGGGYRSGMPRVAAERLQPIVDTMDSHDRLGHETLMVDELSYYGNSRNLLDQYQDMRLDIDSMSYEELLALEERIGHVSTGLSEDKMSKCLREDIYYSIDQNHDGATCPICLEEYNKGEKVGRMKKCGHEYHSDCIKKWLMMKKVCPICKSECSSQELTD